MQPTESETKNLLNSLNTALVAVDETLNIVYANHAGEALFETGYKQLCGHPLSDFFLPSAIDTNRLRAALRLGEDFTENEIRLNFRDHRSVLVDLTVTNLQTDAGPQLLFEVKKIDQQKRISRENLQNAQHYAARELVRGLAHEIKNPLGGIRGAAQLLDKELNDDHREFTRMIIEQSDRLRNLVDRLLGPNALPRLQQCNVHQSLEAVRGLMRVDSDTPVTIIKDYDPSIPDVYIDPDMIQQAVLNIARNSIQALVESNTPNPKITLMTRVERQMTIQSKRHALVVKITIVDNGPGIPAEIKDTLFYPMVSTKQNGSGLGLSISQTLINHHGGKIGVDSHPGHTEFTIFLPIDRKESSNDE